MFWKTSQYSQENTCARVKVADLLSFSSQITKINPFTAFPAQLATQYDSKVYFHKDKNVAKFPQFHNKLFLVASGTVTSCRMNVEIKNSGINIFYWNVL